MSSAAMGSFSVTQSTLVLLASPGALLACAMGALATCIDLCPSACCIWAGWSSTCAPPWRAGAVSGRGLP